MKWKRLWKRITGKLSQRKSSKCLEEKRNPLRKKKDERKTIFPIWYYTFLLLSDKIMRSIYVNVALNFENIIYNLDTSLNLFLV